MTNFIVVKSRSYLICRRLSCCRFMIIVQEVNEVALLVGVVGVGVGTSFVVIIIITGNGFD